MQIVVAVGTSREARAWSRVMAGEPRVTVRVQTLDALWAAADLDARLVPFHLAERWLPTPTVGRATVVARDGDTARVVVGPAWTEGAFARAHDRVARTVLECLFSVAAWNESKAPRVERLGVHEAYLHAVSMEPRAVAEATLDGLRQAREAGVWP